MKSIKKAFTIVELVIVIAVIAILAAVLIPTFSGIIEKSHQSTDIQLVKNLNTAISLEKQSQGNPNAVIPTAHDAVRICESAGYLVDTIVAKSSLDIAWSVDDNYFVLINTETAEVVYPSGEGIVRSNADGNKVNYFIFRTSMPKDNTADVQYSLYAGKGFDAGDGTISINGVGFDAGYNTNIKTVSYTNTTGVAEDVVIRTSTFGTKVVIDGKSGADGDNVSHYGYAAIVDVVNVASASYDECGTVGRLKITNGHIEVMKGGEVFCLMEVGGSSTVATTVNEGGVVHENQENKNVANNEIGKDENGVANGLIDDCGPGKHTFSQFIDDDNNTYDVCTCCGYCLVHVKDASGNEIKQSLNQLVPANDGTDRYIVKEISSGVPDDQITPVLNFLTSATIDKDNLPKENVETTTHLHDYKYTSNDDGTHNGKCNCGEDAITKESCDAYNIDGSCSKCGYKKPNAVHTHNYQYAYNGDKTHKKYCSCGGGTIDSEACDSKGDSGVCSKCGNITKFEVTLNKQDGEGGSDSIYAEKGESMPSITLPTKPGYTFDGYYSAVNGGGTKYYNANGTSAKAYDLQDATTLYAKWNIATYNIIYYDKGGATFSGEYAYYSNTLPTTYKYDKEVTLVDAVSKLCNKASQTINLHQNIRAYYDFAGWYTDKECTNKITGLAAYTYTADITLYAKWTPKVYTIVYHDKSSMEHVNNSLSVALTGLPTTHTYGTETKLPNPVEREGWVFLGWYTDLNCKTNKITSIEALSDYVDYVEYHSSDSEPRRIHLYVKWAYLHTVTLKNGDTTMGTVYQPEDEPMVKLTSAQIPTTTKTGYTFDGYYSAPYGGGTKYYNSDGTSANDFLYFSHAPGQNTNHTFYARFKPIKYTITYNLNGGSHGANYPTTHTYDTATTLVNPTKDGYNFMGWYTDSAFSGTALTSLSATGYTKNITLYAKWAKASSWKPLNTGGKLYYPVLGGSNPQPTKFAYSTDGENFTEITKPDGGYTMSGVVAKYAALGQLYYQGGSITVARISAYDGKDDGETICVIRDSSGCYDDIEPDINGITIGQICDSYDVDKDYCLTCIYWEEEYWVYYSRYSFDWNENGPGNLKYVIYRTFN